MIMGRGGLLWTFLLWAMTALVGATIGADWIAANLHRPIGCVVIGWVLYGCPMLGCGIMSHFAAWGQARSRAVLPTIRDAASTVKHDVMDQPT